MVFAESIFYKNVYFNPNNLPYLDKVPIAPVSWGCAARHGHESGFDVLHSVSEVPCSTAKLAKGTGTPKATDSCQAEVQTRNIMRKRVLTRRSFDGK